MAMSLPEFMSSIQATQRAAQKLIDEVAEKNRMLADFDACKKQNEQLVAENESLKKELDVLKNTIAFSKEQVAAISQEQRDAIETELNGWNESIYDLCDREIDNSNCCSSEYYERERDRIGNEQSDRYMFIQKLLTILGG